MRRGASQGIRVFGPAVVCLTLAVVSTLSMTAAFGAEGARFEPAVRSPLGVVSAENAAASQAGVAVLRDGGNAVDAAATAVFAIGVTAPYQCGLGGGVRILYRNASGQATVIDAGGKSPAAAKPTTLGSTPDGIDSSPGIGHRVVSVPGTVAGLAEVLDEYGTISLRRAIAPAERLARKGFRVGADMDLVSRFFTDRLRKFPATAEIFLRPNRKPYRQGSRLVQRDLAKTLRAIASDGPSAFYTGSVAKKIAAEFSKSPAYPGDKAILTARDLGNYKPIHRRVIEGTYRGAQIISVPPPMYGVAVVEALHILEGFPLSEFGQGSADAFHARGEAMKVAETDADAVVTDPRSYDIPIDRLVSPRFAERRRAEISMAKARIYKQGIVGNKQGIVGNSHGSHTTSVEVIDEQGRTIVITCTLSSFYGSAVVAEKTGVLLNNTMTGFFRRQSRPRRGQQVRWHGDRPGHRRQGRRAPRSARRRRWLGDLPRDPRGDLQHARFRDGSRTRGRCRATARVPGRASALLGRRRRPNLAGGTGGPERPRAPGLGSLPAKPAPGCRLRLLRRDGVCPRRRNRSADR